MTGLTKISDLFCKMVYWEFLLACVYIIGHNSVTSAFKKKKINDENAFFH